MADEIYHIVTFGNSLTAGYGLKPKESYPNQLEQLLQAAGYLVKVTNAGISGDTTRGGLERLSAIVNLMPDLVILELGPNDFLRAIPPQYTKENLEMIVKMLLEHQIEVILVGFKAPISIGLSYKKAYDDIFDDIASRYPVTLTDVFLNQVQGRLDYNQNDGIHPNFLGTQQIAKNLMPVVQGRLDRMSKP